jgi:hypothetical protein
MIGKISKGTSFAGLGRYLFGPGRREEHIDPRVIASEHVTQINPRSWRDWATDMAFYAARRPDIGKPAWHCSLRTAPGDPILDDTRWAAIATQHIAAMGLADHPWVAVRHGDDHIHLVACRISPTGAVWRDSHDYARSRQSCRRIERDHHLTTLGQDHRAGRLASTTAGERARAQRRGVDPERARLRDAMHAARIEAAGTGVTGWERQLAARGVLFQAKTTTDGTIIGYRVSLPGWTDPTGAQIWLKASQVDRNLSWTRIRTELDPTHRNARHPTAARLAAQAHADPTNDSPTGRRAGGPEPHGPMTAGQLAALAYPAPPRQQSAPYGRALPAHTLARLLAALRANDSDGSAATGLYLLYCLTALADAIADLRDAQQRLHQTRVTARRPCPPPSAARPVSRRGR